MRVEGRRALWWLLWVWCYGVGVVSGEQGHWAPRAGAERFKVSHKAPPPYQTPPLTTHGGHYYHAPPLPQAPPPPFPQGQHGFLHVDALIDLVMPKQPKPIEVRQLPGSRLPGEVLRPDTQRLMRPTKGRQWAVEMLGDQVDETSPLLRPRHADPSKNVAAPAKQQRFPFPLTNTKVRTTQPKTRAKELARGFGRFEGHANRWVDAKHKLVDHPRHMEPTHNRTQRAVAVQKARGSPVARRITKTLVLLVGDTGDRLLLEDWCRRFRTPLKPWVGFTPKSGRLARGAPAFCTIAGVTIAHFFMLGVHPTGPYRHYPRTMADAAFQYPPLPRDTAQRLPWLRKVKSKFGRGPTLVVLSSLHWEIARWVQVSSKRFSRFRDVESARVMPYINTRIDDEYLINVQWLMHQVKLLFPASIVAWRTTPPPLPVLYTRQWLRHDSSHSEVMVAVEQLNRASRKAAAHQKVLLVDVAMMFKGQYPQSYLRPTSPPSAAALTTPQTQVDVDVMHLRHDINEQVVNLLLNICDHPAPAGHG